MLGYPYGWIIAAVIFVLFISMLILLSPVVAHFQLQHQSDNDDIEIQIKALYGLLRYEVFIPTIEFSGRVLRFHEKMLKSGPGISKTNEKDEGIDKDKVDHAIDTLKKVLHLTNNLPSWIMQSLNKVKILEWNWSTSVGMGDAMWTAMTTGFVWSVKTTLLGVISQIVHLKSEPSMAVQPIYDKRSFTTELSCVAKISFGAAVLAGLHFFARAKKSKESVKEWKNILSKA
ncbi:MAG: DUF2953 domain-containing protein [Candidatus Pristimantibacillus sp.]